MFLGTKVDATMKHSQYTYIYIYIRRYADILILSNNNNQKLHRYSVESCFCPFFFKNPKQYRLMAWRRKSKSVSVKAELCSSEATPVRLGCVWSKAKPITASPGGLFHSKIEDVDFGDAKPVIFGLTQKSLKPVK